MPQSHRNSWLHRFACLTALATLALIAVGGLVTSHGAGMAVPDWPNSYGYSMFRFPISQWVGGILYEHSHRLIASLVGLLVVALTRWLGGSASRLPLGIIGALEVITGEAILHIWPEWKGAGYFLSGIGVIVLMAGIVWFRSQPAEGCLPMLGWIAFVAVQLQGLLGGLRVVLLKDELGIFHATLAQLFFVVLCAIALMTSPWWARVKNMGTTWKSSLPVGGKADFHVVPNLPLTASGRGFGFACITLLILIQLILGATMRHQHAGLAIPDFPLAYGKVWPAMDAQSVELDNQHREELVSMKPITGFQIACQMAHRLLAAAILIAIIWSVASLRRAPSVGGRALSRLGMVWVILVLMQVSLGAATIWSKKAADIATAHVLVGALLLATGTFLSMIAFQRRPSPESSEVRIGEAFGRHPISGQETPVTI
jgi:cytochrome c oxidase assembly protein subunit 15